MWKLHKSFQDLFIFFNTTLWAKQATLTVSARRIHYVNEKFKHDPSQLLGFPERDHPLSQVCSKDKALFFLPMSL